MRFPNVDTAQAWSTSHEHHIFVEIEGVDGILEVYPGGRKIFRGADKGKVYARYVKRLTPDSEFYDRLGKL